MVVYAEPRSACPELRSTCPDLIGRGRAHRAHPCPPKFLPYYLFADPRPLNLYATIFYKNIRGRGSARRSDLRTFPRADVPCVPKSFPRHRSEISPVSPIIATLSKTHSRKSFACHTSETPRGSSVPQTDLLRNVPVVALPSLIALFAQRVFDNSFPHRRFRTLSKNCRGVPQLFPLWNQTHSVQ
jgi:hypothetical protein